VSSCIVYALCVYVYVSMCVCAPVTRMEDDFSAISAPVGSVHSVHSRHTATRSPKTIRN
jgi:hypothetical protein